MLIFTNSKINIGLDIISRREDGYHELSTVMVPVDWGDVLEVVPAKGDETTLTISGREVNCPMEKNLVVKALRALEAYIGYEFPPVDIYLLKNVPDGAGLGGGSADASGMLLLIREMFDLALTDSQLAEVAAKVGADCPLFVYNKPMLATGIGTTLSPIELPQLRGKVAVIVKPPVSVSTAEAYAGVKPKGAVNVRDLAKVPIEEWNGVVVNDFEASIFPNHPEISAIKDELYGMGALYASMSGSGSAVYGIFNDDDTLPGLGRWSQDGYECKVVELVP